jgi:hypothetical protein
MVDENDNGIEFDYTVDVTEGSAPAQGDHCSNPFIIPEAFPYQDADTSHNTCNFHNYSWIGDGAPDVIYEMTLASSHMLNINLCQSTWDTKLGVFQTDCYGDTAYLYNDDGCYTRAVQSEVEGYFPPGTYYVVVDGYSSYCGAYILDIYDIPFGEFDVNPTSITDTVATYGPGNIATEVLTVSNGGTDTLRVAASVEIDPPPVSASVPRKQFVDSNTELLNVKTEKTPSNRTPNVPDPGVILQGGDDIANATVIASLPYDITGTTAGYTDDDDESCEYGYAPGTPDVVYSYTVTADSYFDISLCDTVGTLFDTKLWVYDATDTSVVPGSCVDDAATCENYQSEVIGLYLTAGLYYIVVDSYDSTEYGDYHLTMDFGDVPPDDPACPPASFFSQEPELDDWAFATSDSNDVFEYLRYESFAAAYGTIEEIYFWGVDGYHDGSSWSECDEEPMDFNIAIYADAGGVPGMPVHSGVYSITPEVTTWETDGWTVKEYHVTLTTSVSLWSGWISIQSVSVGSPQNCYFLWAASPVGTADDASLCYYADGDSISAYDRDLSICLIGPEEELWLDIELATRDNSVEFDIAPGGADVDINVTMDAENLTSEGLYTGAINFVTNDPQVPTYRLPVNFQVGSSGPDCYEYMAGDVNHALGLWKPAVIGGDVTYLVGYFKGSSTSNPCLLNNPTAPNPPGPYFWASADANGDCRVMGSDVVRMVSYFRGAQPIEWCDDYYPCWHPVDTSFDPPPDTAPTGWPGCVTPPVTGKVIPTGSATK